jgi:hypothetical protein
MHDIEAPNATSVTKSGILKNFSDRGKNRTHDLWCRISEWFDTRTDISMSFAYKESAKQE